MGLLDSYQAVYADLSDAELAEVGSFVSDVISAKAVDDNVKIGSLIRDALTELSTDDDAFDLFFNTTDFIEQCGAADEKVAVASLLDCVGGLVGGPAKTAAVSANSMSGAQKWQLGLSAAGVGLAAAPFIAHVARKASQANKIKASLTQVLRDHPHLKEDPHLHRYFQAVADFAPTVAGNPLVAGNVLNAMHQIGPGAVTPKAIGELLSVEKDYQGQPQGAALLSETAKPVSDLGETIHKIHKKD